MPWFLNIQWSPSILQPLFSILLLKRNLLIHLLFPFPWYILCIESKKKLKKILIYKENNLFLFLGGSVSMVFSC
jgi:type II restriction/modification system DNA methylase subunit YeeA